MTVAAIIPTYNVEGSIERAIRSAQAQTLPPAEIIVVDDASTDGTCQLVERLAAADPRIRLIACKTNGGPSRARNIAIAAATSSRVALLDGDDAWRPERLERMSAVMDATGAEFVADNLVIYDIWADREGRMAYRPRQPLTEVDAAIYFSNCVREKFQFSILKPLLDRAFLLRHRILYREDVRYGEDLFYYADLFLAGGRGVVMAEGYYIYTSQVGEFSGRRSPLTRSSPDFARMIAALAALERECSDAEARAAIRRCIDSFEATRKANAARALRHERRWLAYAAAMADRDVLGQWLRLRIRRLQVRLGG